jgi:hypothetical protein
MINGKRITQPIYGSGLKKHFMLSYDMNRTQKIILGVEIIALAIALLYLGLGLYRFFNPVKPVTTPAEWKAIFRSPLLF